MTKFQLVLKGIVNKSSLLSLIKGMSKILIYSEYYMKPSGFGREIKDLIPFLIQAGHDVRQVALGFNGFPEDEQIKVYPGKFYKLDNYYAREMLEFALSDFEPDIILTLGDYYMLSKIAFAMAFPRKGKWIHWGVLDGAPLGFGSSEPLKWVDYNLYHSQFAKDEIERVFPRIKGEVLFPATDPNTFFEMDKKQLKEDFNCENKFIISTVARNQTRKNLPALIKAMPEIVKQIPNSMLLLGMTHDTTTPEGAKEGHALEYLIDYYKANNYIVMPREKSKDGSLSDKTIREIYNLGDLFVLPTMGEGFGMIFHESMACGVPVLTTNCSACPGTLGGHGYLLKPDATFHHADGVSQAVVNADELASAVVSISKDKKWLEARAIAGKKFVSKFTPKNQAEKLEKIIQRVIAKDYPPIIAQ